MRISTQRKYKTEPIEILELRNIKAELKIYHRDSTADLNTQREKISKREDTIFEIAESEEQGGKGRKKSKQSLRTPSNRPTYTLWEYKEKKKRQRDFFEK